MAGKVFAAGGDAGGLQLADDHGAEPRHIVGPLGQRPIANRRVRRAGQHVQHGRVIEVDADGGELAGERAGESSRECLVAAATERQGRRPLGKGRLQPGDAAAFLIDGNPERPIPRERRDLA